MVNDYKENYGNGWISLYRSIRNHWIFENEKWLKWWIIMLFEVNHKENKITLGYDIITIPIGGSANSLRTWGNKFNCSPKTVNSFFDMLQKDNMITKKTIGKGKQSTTLINIGNYTEYQNTKETQSKHKVNDRYTQSKRELPTNNNDNKGNNVNNDNNIPEFSEFFKYARSKKKNVSEKALKLKYDAWKENNWKDGNDKKIKNWKVKLLNTLAYIKEDVKNDGPTSNLAF